MEAQVVAVIEAVGRGNTDIRVKIDALLDRLDDLLRRQDPEEVADD